MRLESGLGGRWRELELNRIDFIAGMWTGRTETDGADDGIIS